MFQFRRNYNNKLNCSSFTTVRLSDKYVIGDKVDIFWGSRHFGTTIVKAKSTFKIEDIKENFFLDILLRLDCEFETTEQFIDVMKECYSDEQLEPYLSGEKEFVLYYLFYIK